MKNKNNKTVFFGIVAFFLILIVVLVGVFAGGSDNKTVSNEDGKEVVSSGKSLEDMLKKVNVKESTPVKASVSLETTALYDELPEIEKYPLSVRGTGDINIEIFASGEKAGEGNDSWLIDVANDFNHSGVYTESGKLVNISVRKMSSGLGGDYIIANKYLPDLYTPSSYLNGEYVLAKGGDIELHTERLVGNTAGVLVNKSVKYKTIRDVADAVGNNELTLGYTHPETSATGMNLLMTLLSVYGGDDMFNADAETGFIKFQKNIPYIASTTQQMSESASNGALDGMVMEYQTYVNNENLSTMYNFIPFGVRHDNPLYIVKKSEMNSDRLEAIDLVADYLLSEDSQNIASKKGFNQNNEYTSDLDIIGAQVVKALDFYKKNKDSGKDIIAVFVADCSGSMDGDPIIELKNSLSNGMQYINENNMVGLVSYSSDVTIEVPIAEFDLNQRAYFQGAINGLQASGGTASYEAVLVGIDMIKKAKEEKPDAKVMLFLLSDGYANGAYSLKDIEGVISSEGIPCYTIGYTSGADKDELSRLSSINEAVSISADSDDIVYKIKSLFNTQM